LTRHDGAESLALMKHPMVRQRVYATSLLSGRAVALLLTALVANLESAAPPPLVPPYPTGTHLQLVRKFFPINDGLAADDVRAVTVTRDGLVLAAAGTNLLRLQDERWTIQKGPSDVTALFAPLDGPIALAGTTNGVWAFIDGEWRLEANAPNRVIAFAAEPSGILWTLAHSGAWRRENSWKLIHTIDNDIVQPHSLLPHGAEDVLLSSESGLFGLMGKRRYWLPLEVRPGGLLSSRTRGLAWLDSDHFLVATDKGLNLSNGARGWESLTAEDGLPILDLHHVVRARDGTIWLGSNEGLIRWKSGTWSYLASKRWLPDDRVTALASAPDGSVWVGTAKGLAHIYHRSMTLADKATILQQTLEARNRRHGYVTQMHLRAPAVTEGALQEVSDNDGLWTALYIASQSFRYAVTKSPEAKAQAWRSMQALLRLESITGIAGFPARAICHADEPQFNSRSMRSQANSEWHESPVEKDWFWKGETSSDEIDGHYFGWFIFYELAADEEQKRHVRATCKRVTDHILDHGYYLVDKDGKPTTWGVWAPEKLNDDPKWWEERGLNSLEILSHLKVASRIVGDARYEHASRELIQKHHYALNTLKARIEGAVSHDNQLLFLAYYPLLQLEKGDSPEAAALRAIYSASLKRTWDFVRIEANPVWNFICLANLGRDSFSEGVEESIESLREIPLDFVQWRTHNDRRADLKFDSTGKRLLRPLPWTERTLRNWDSNAFALDGGSDLVEADPTIWLLPYWMGRHHRIID
jgi:hypothetical protein